MHCSRESPRRWPVGVQGETLAGRVQGGGLEGTVGVGVACVPSLWGFQVGGTRRALLGNTDCS